MRAREIRFNHFLSFSFMLHLLFLLFLSFLSINSCKKEPEFLEVTLLELKMEAGGRSVQGRDLPKKLFTGAGLQYPFRLRSSSPRVLNPRREFAEPAYTPVSPIPSVRGDMVSAGPGRRSVFHQGMVGPGKRGPDFPSGSDVSRYSGERMGIAGPAASREILYYEYPLYPEWAQKKGIEANVKLRFWVEPDGNVDEVIVEKRGYLQLDNLAVQALKKWRFEPLAPGSSRVRQWGTIEIIFTLR